jgi:hypothetical protein
MIKLTATKTGMRILTIKAFGCYLNMSFGRCAKPAPARLDLRARLCIAATPAQREAAEITTRERMLAAGWQADEFNTPEYRAAFRSAEIGAFRKLGVVAA